MRNQYIVIGVGFLCAAIAVPIVSHQWLRHMMFYLGLFVFIGIPFISGLLQQQKPLPSVFVTITLLAGCPVVYILSQRYSSVYESFGSGYFLLTGWTLLFVFASWLVRSFPSQKWGSAAVAAFMTMTSGIAVWFVLFMSLIFE